MATPASLKRDVVAIRFTNCYVIRGCTPDHKAGGHGPWTVSFVNDAPMFDGILMGDFCPDCRKVIARRLETAAGKEIVAGGFCHRCSARLAAVAAAPTI